MRCSCCSNRLYTNGVDVARGEIRLIAERTEDSPGVPSKSLPVGITLSREDALSFAEQVRNAALSLPE